MIGNIFSDILFVLLKVSWLNLAAHLPSLRLTISREDGISYPRRILRCALIKAYILYPGLKSY